MGNRALITLGDHEGRTHPVALYVHWNGGLESALAFMTYTWAHYPRGRDDLFTFHARLCQVIGNFFADGLSLYALSLEEAASWSPENGTWHFRVAPDGVTLPANPAAIHEAQWHRYWKESPSILELIHRNMPAGTPKEAVS